MFPRILAALFIILLPAVSNAQTTTTTTTTHHHKHHKTAKDTTRALPDWATAHKYDAKSHVYFPDYNSFYDPGRGGYMFWENGQWSFTPTVPPYMQKVDLSKARVQILKNVSLDLHPELDYPRYMKLYPALPENVDNDVPVPSTTSLPGNP